MIELLLLIRDDFLWADANAMRQEPKDVTAQKTRLLDQVVFWLDIPAAHVELF